MASRFHRGPAACRQLSEVKTCASRVTGIGKTRCCNEGLLPLGIHSQLAGGFDAHKKHRVRGRHSLLYFGCRKRRVEGGILFALGSGRQGASHSARPVASRLLPRPIFIGRSPKPFRLNGGSARGALCQLRGPTPSPHAEEVEGRCTVARTKPG